MKFIKLTQKENGRNVFININNIDDFVEYDNATVIEFNSGEINVIETPEEIIAMLESEAEKDDN